MRSEIEVVYYRNGAQVGSHKLNQVDVHPGFGDFFSWDDLINAIKAGIGYFSGDETAAKKETEDLFKRLFSSNDQNVYRNSEISLSHGGPVYSADGPVYSADEAQIWFRAWSEDDL